jgi:hypothetical protein
VTSDSGSSLLNETGQSAADDSVRPFYFMVPFWGERYRRYFADNLLPSLLAPNNLPLLRAERGHRFLLATTRDDWDAIIGLPIMARLRRHATPTLIEIPRPGNDTAPGSTNAIMYQNVAQRLLVMAAFEARAYGSLFSPDFIISDGMIASLLGHVRAGRRLVLCPSLRQIEESAIAELERSDYLGPNPSATATAINVPQRVLADILVRHLHPEMAIFEEGAPGQPPLAPFRYWRIPNQNGIFLHTFHGVPVLMDYGSIDDHDVACLEQDVFENIYVARNFASVGKSHVVQDSDEFCILSLTPAAVGQMSVTNPVNAIVGKSEGLSRIFPIALSISYHSAGMPLKRDLFRQSVRWHAGDMDAAALEEESGIAGLIERAMRLSLYTGALGRLLRKYRQAPILTSLIPYARALIRALQGDRVLWSHIAQRVSFMSCRPFKRTLFWFASGGKNLDLIDPYHFSFRCTVGRRAVDVKIQSPDNAVILGLGQSNIANECDPTALYEAKEKVFNFNLFDGKYYLAKDPLLGASHDRSNVLTRLGDLLVERGNYRSVVLVPIAHGGTFVREWSPEGRMFPRLQWALDRLREKQAKVTHIVWQQGEAEAAEHNADPGEWMRYFTAMADSIRAAGVEAPIYVAQCTICCNDPNERIRSAQRGVVNPLTGILPGPDIDLIGRDERYDGCHLSGDGLRHAAELWYAALSRPN